MALILRRSLLVAFAALPVACGDGEADQRRAFIAFLQTRILDKPGIHLARPTPDEEKSWGDYAKHYAIITGFNDGLSQRVSKPMAETAQRGAVRSIQDLMTRRREVAEVRIGMAALGTELDQQFTTAEAARAALKQPADLKPVFDAAYDRLVAAPARAFKEVFPIADQAFAAALDLAETISSHPRGVTVTGSLVQVSDPALQREMTAKLATMNERGQAAQQAQSKIMRLIAGG